MLAREGDWNRPENYAWRTVETALDVFIETALEPGCTLSYTSVPVAVVLGQPGNGIRSILACGVAERWRDVAANHTSPLPQLQRDAVALGDCVPRQVICEMSTRASMVAVLRCGQIRRKT